MSPLVLTIYLLQTTACVAAATLFLGLWRAHRHEYLRLWGWSWLALAAFEATSAMAFQLAMTIRDGGHPLRLAVTSVSLTAAAWHLWWLLQGTLFITWSFRPSRRVVRTICAGAVLMAIGVALITVPVSSDVRRVVRAGLPLAMSSVVFAAVFVLMVRSVRAGPRLGANILGITALAYAVVEAALLCAFIYDVRNPVAFPISEFAGVLTVLLQVVMALGMVVWLLDDQRAAAAAATAALSITEARYRRLVEHARLVAWEYDSSIKQFTYVSPQAERLLGYTLEEWRKPGFWFDHLHPDDRDRARAYSHDQSQRGLEHAYEYRMLHRDGGVVWVRDLTSVDRQEGKVIGLRGVLIDITDRKAVEQDMHHMQQRLSSVVAAAPMMLWALDHQGRFTLSEGRGLKALGLRAGQVVGKSLVELYGEHPRITDIHSRAIKGDTVVESIELNDLVFDTRVSPMTDAGGAISGVIGVAVDVTQRHRAQEALRRSEEQLRGLFDSAVDTLWDWDVPSDHCTFSLSWRELVGYDLEDFERDRLKWSELLHPDDRSAVLRGLDAALRDDRVHYEIEYRLRTRDGAWKWVLSRGRVVTRDSTGRALRMVGSITDITERKQVETALRESEARLRAVIDNAPSVAIQGYDLNGRVLFWNRASEAIFGFSDRDALGQTLDRLILDEESCRAFIQTLRDLEKGAEPVTFENTMFRRRDGRVGWCYSTVFKIPGGATPTFICMDVDISERRQAEQALERSNQLQLLLLSELDHRVRNNLASLMALIDMSSQHTRSVREFAVSVRSRVQAMSVVHALLSHQHWRAVDLRQLLLTLAPVGGQERIAIDGPPVSVLPRQATALGMVLQELLTNSQKYGALSAPEGTVSVRWSVGNASSEGGGRTHTIEWRERGGPEIIAPVRDGIGTGLIHGLVRSELRGEASLQFERGGAAHTLILVLDAGDAPSTAPEARQAVPAGAR